MRCGRKMFFISRMTVDFFVSSMTAMPRMSRTTPLVYGGCPLGSICGHVTDIRA
jgi:hypothetical protein